MGTLEKCQESEEIPKT